MNLSKRDIKKFQEIYRNKFKKEISYERASESGRKLVNLIKLITEE